MKTKNLLFLGIASASLIIAAGCKTPPTATLTTAAVQQRLSPADALKRLQDGNERFVSGKPMVRDWQKLVAQAAPGQYPIAAIVSCMDSRASAELFFDQGLGDIFNLRVAGNVINPDILGSLEYAVKAAGTRLIVVLGHTDCGAVKGAAADVHLGNLTGLLAKIKPAEKSVPASVQPRSDKNKDFVEQLGEANVHHALQEIRDQSPLLQEVLQSGKLVLVGGVYDLKTGRVRFFEK
jgi:carbonic anhydrase